MDDAGEFRHYGVRVLGNSVARSNYATIPEKIDKLVEYMNAPTDNIIKRLAKTHADFELIHPFGNGNGRIGRLIMFTQAIQYGRLTSKHTSASLNKSSSHARFSL